MECALIHKKTALYTTRTIGKVPLAGIMMELPALSVQWLLCKLMKGNNNKCYTSKWCINNMVYEVSQNNLLQNRDSVWNITERINNDGYKLQQRGSNNSNKALRQPYTVAATNCPWRVRDCKTGRETAESNAIIRFVYIAVVQWPVRR